MPTSKKIRILHTHQIIRSGGVEQRKHLLCKSLPKDKYEQKIVCTEAIGSKPVSITNDGCQILTTGTMRHPFQFSVHKKLQRIIKEFKPHIIHGTVFEGNSMAAINGFLQQVPIVILEETSHPIRRSKRANLLFKLYSSTADAIIGVSPAVTKFLRDDLKISSDKIKLIMNGIGSPIQEYPESFKLKQRQKYNIPQDAFVIGSVGRMDNNIKKFDLIIQSAAEIIKNLKIPIYVVLVGDGKLKVEYESLARRLGIEANVIFTGFQEHVNDFYCMMDTFILASTTESFGFVLVEAWYHSLPIIASNVGGIPYVVDHDTNGLLFEAGNQNELIQNILKLRENPKLRKAMGANGLMKASLEFNSNRYVDDIDDLYTELMINKFPKGW